MLWILVASCLIVAIFAIALGGSHYKKYHKFSSLVLCSMGCGLFAFTCMFATMVVFLT